MQALSGQGLKGVAVGAQPHLRPQPALTRPVPCPSSSTCSLAGIDNQDSSFIRRPSRVERRGAQAIEQQGRARSNVATMASQNGAGPSSPGGKVEVSLAELEDLCTKAMKTLGYTDAEVQVFLEVGGQGHMLRPAMQLLFGLPLARPAACPEHGEPFGAASLAGRRSSSNKQRLCQRAAHCLDLCT